MSQWRRHIDVGNRSECLRMDFTMHRIRDRQVDDERWRQLQRGRFD